MNRFHIAPLMAVLLISLLAVSAVSAAPPLPSTLYGTAQLKGAAVPSGTVISAWIDGAQYAETAAFSLGGGSSVYVLDVPGDDPTTPEIEGGVDGDTVVLKVDGFDADQTALWSGGTHVRLDLNATPPPAAPVAADQAVTTDEDTPVAITLSASDINDDPLTYTVVTSSTHGSLSGLAPFLTYAPDPNYNGADSFTFMVNDGAFDSNVATVAITVTAQPDPPELAPIGDLTVDEGTAQNVLVSATDPDGDAITLSATGLPSFATFTDHGDGTGTLSIAPDYDNAGLYAGLTFTASDGSLTDSEILNLTVNEALPIPKARFSAAKGLNVAALDHGATIVDFSSFWNNDANALPDKAIDENDRTRWRTATGQITDQWFIVQLAGHEAQVIDRFLIEGNSNNLGIRDFQVLVSTDGTDEVDFTTLLTGTVPNDGNRHEYTFPLIRARYLKLVARNNWGSNNNIEVVDFIVPTRDREGGIVSLFAGPPARIADFSSQYSDSYRPDLAIDESDSSAWRSANGQTTDQWLTVELGGGLSYTIDGVRLRSSNVSEAANEFEIRVSTTTPDETSFSTVFSSSGASVNSLQEFRFGPVQARYVQLLVRNNHGSNCCVRVNNFQVLAPDGANLARAAGVGAFAVDVSSQRANGLGPENAIDYDTQSYWETADGAMTDQWLKVRLIAGGPYQIDRISLQGDTGGYAPQNFEIRTSVTTPDDAAFTTVYSGTLPNDARPHWFLFPRVKARYVQLYVRDNYGASTVRVRDFRVFSPDLGGSVVPFDNLSTSPFAPIVAWQWDFGDGNIAAIEHPNHTYAGPGTYPVRLTVTNSVGLTDTATMSYTVLQAPLPDFSWSPPVPEEVQFFTLRDESTDPDGQIVGRTWRFPHTGATQSGPTASTSLPDNGDWPISLTVIDSQLLQFTVVHTVPVTNAPPIANAGPDQTVVWDQIWATNPSVGDPSSIDRITVVCDWDFGDGATLHVDNCIGSRQTSYAYPLPGIYTVTLTVTDKDGGQTSDDMVVTVVKRDTFLINYGVLSTAPDEAEIRAALFDNYNFNPLSNREILFETSAGTVSATTNNKGIATAAVRIAVGEQITVTSSYSGTYLYNPSTDTDVLKVAPEVPRGDIVFIIDESDSMFEEQDLVVAQVETIAEQLAAAIDYRLGLVGFGISSHVWMQLQYSGQAHIHQTLTVDVDAFKWGLIELTVGGGFEPGFQATTLAMSDEMGFRPGAGVCAIMITDEDADRSDDAPETLADALAALNARDAVFVGIVDPTSGSTADHYGPNAGSLAAETGGQVFDLRAFQTGPGPVLANVIDVCTKVIAERVPADLVVEKSDDRTLVQPGEQITYTITITDVSIRDAFGVVITDTLPDNTAFVAASDGGLPSAGAVVWPAVDLVSGQTITRIVTVRVDDPLPPGTTAITNTVEAVDDGFFGADPTPENNRATDVDSIDAAPNLRLSKDAGLEIVMPGGRLTYTLTYNNLQPYTARGVVISETVPTHTRFIQAASDPAWDCPPGDGSPAGTMCTLTVGDLSGGASGSVQFVVEIDAVVASDVIEISNTATISDGGEFGPDRDPADNTTAVSTPLVHPNRPPEAVDDIAIVDEGSFENRIAVLQNDSDPDGDPLHIDVVSAPLQGTAILSGTTEILYTPASGFSGTDVFTYTISDGVLVDTATVTVTVRPVNDPPLADDQSVSTDEDVSVDITLTASDVDGDSLVFTIVTSPTHGSLSGTAPNLTYTPDPDYNGADSLTFTASDGISESNVAAVSIAVDPVNDPPSLAPIADQLLDEGATLNVDVSASDPDGDSLSLSTAGLPIFATFTDNGDGTGVIAMAPGLNDAGVYPNVAVSASDGAFTDTQTFSITVNNVNRGPDLAPIADQVLDEGTILDVALSATDPDGDAIALSASGLPSFASFTDSGDGTGLISLTPGFGDAGVYPDIQVVASDGALSDTETFSITVGNVNRAPSLTPISDQVLDEGATLDVALSASDPDDDPLSLSASGLPAFATFTDNGDGTGNLALTPGFDDAGIYPDVSITASDGALTDTGIFSITVNDVNRAPVADDQTVITDEDTPVNITLSASDADGDPLTFTVVSDPAHGALSGAAPELTYTPDTDYHGPDSFTFTASDGISVSNIATVTITVDPVNDVPVAADDAYITDEGTALDVVAPGVLSNDSDADGDALSAVLVSDVSHGALTLNADGSFGYTPDADFDGSDSFTYQAYDGTDGSNVATVSITVNSLNDPPVITHLSPDPQVIEENSTTNLTGIFTDPNLLDSHTVRIDWGDSHIETLALPVGDRTFSASHRYPDDGLTSAPSDDYIINVTVTDDAGASDAASTTVTVNNVAPTIEVISVPIEAANINDQSSISVTVTFSDPAGLNDVPYICDFDFDNDGVVDDAVQTNALSCMNSSALNYAGPGVYTVKVTVTDKDGGSGSATATELIAIYDPDGGFVTGGGWIDSPEGAYVPDPTLTGRVNFGFVSKYKKGADVPTGQTEFQFRMADLNFHSDTYDWLVVAGAKAEYKGTGTINGKGEYKFMLTVIDADVNGNDNFVDRFRLKIWYEDSEGGEIVVYDSGLGADDGDDNAMIEISGGSIVIH